MAVQIELAHEIATNPPEHERLQKDITQTLFEQAAAFGNRAVAETVWPHVDLTFINLSRWQKLTEDPVLVPRLYEVLLNTELEEVDSDYTRDEDKRRYAQHNKAVVSLAQQLAESGSWADIPVLYTKMYYSPRPLFKVLTEEAVRQGNQTALLELIGAQAESETHPFKVAAAMTSIEPAEAAHLLAQVGFAEFQAISEDLEATGQQKYQTAFKDVLAKTRATVVLADFLGHPLPADTKRGQTNWTRSMESLEREAIKLLAAMQVEGVETAPFVDELAMVHADAGSWLAIESILGSLHSRWTDPYRPDERVYEQFVTGLFEHVTDAGLLVRIADKLKEQAEYDEKYHPGETYGVRSRSWDPDQMVNDPSRVFPDTYRNHSRHERASAFKDMPIETVLEIQDPTARADGLLAHLNDQNAAELAPHLAKTTHGIFDQNERLARQFDFLHRTI
jgi:hypothetical protein